MMTYMLFVREAIKISPLVSLYDATKATINGVER